MFPAFDVELSLSTVDLDTARFHQPGGGVHGTQLTVPRKSWELSDRPTKVLVTVLNNMRPDLPVNLR